MTIIWSSFEPVKCTQGQSQSLFGKIDQSAFKMDSKSFVPAKLTFSEYLFKIFEIPAIDTLAWENKVSLGEQSLL